MQKKEPRYQNGIEYWQCPTCKRWLPCTEYYFDKRTSNKLKSQCKKCHTAGSLRTRDAENTRRINREYMRRTRRKNADKFRERERLSSRKRMRTQKTIAREILNRAVKSGKIAKPERCESCGKIKKLTAHHPDYSRPLEVVWLCYECHGNN